MTGHNSAQKGTVPAETAEKGQTTTIEQDIDILAESFEGFAKGVLDITQVQAAFGAIHHNRRGKAQLGAMAKVMGNLDKSVLEALFTGMNDLPTKSASRVNRPTLEKSDRKAIRDAILDSLDTVDLVINDEKGELPEHVKVALDAAIARTVKFVTNMPIGTKDRKSYDSDPTDLFDMEDETDIVLEASYKGQNVTAVLNSDNTVTLASDGQNYSSLSKAAKAVTGSPVNGWDFWSHNGQKLAVIRDNSDK